MNSDELQELIDCISIETQYNTKETKYDLSEKALSSEIIDILKDKFSHYDSVELVGKTLILKHPTS
jgi:hypothetical protein